MDVTLIGTKVTQNINTFAFEKNNGVDVINVTVDTDASWSYKLDVQYTQKLCSGERLYNVIDLTRDGNVCSATLTAGMLPFSGKYMLQLRGINADGRVYHSEQFNGWVKYSIDPGAAYDPVPSEFYQIEANITSMNNHPPKPGDNGYWLIWNVTKQEYEESDTPLPEGELPSVDETTKGKYLTNDGTEASWADVEALPEMSAATKGQYLTNDGETAEWADVDALPAMSSDTAGKMLTNDGEKAEWGFGTPLTVNITDDTLNPPTINQTFQSLLAAMKSNQTVITLLNEEELPATYTNSGDGSVISIKFAESVNDGGLDGAFVASRAYNLRSDDTFEVPPPMNAFAAFPFLNNRFSAPSTENISGVTIAVKPFPADRQSSTKPELYYYEASDPLRRCYITDDGSGGYIYKDCLGNEYDPTPFSGGYQIFAMYYNFLSVVYKRSIYYKQNETSEDVIFLSGNGDTVRFGEGGIRFLQNSTGSVPKATAADKGKTLTVDENGYYQLADPAKDVMVVNFTADDDGNWSADKNWDEVASFIENGGWVYAMTGIDYIPLAAHIPNAMISFISTSGDLTIFVLWESTGEITIEDSKITAVNYTEQDLDADQQAQARKNIGLDQVDNTSDTNKPVSTAQEAAIKVVQDALDQYKTDVANGTVIPARATGDASGNNIANTYATKQELANIDAVQIRNKDEVINATQETVQTVATAYMVNNYGRQPQNLDGLILTITDLSNDKILYIYSAVSSLWINAGINGVDLSKYVGVAQQTFTDAEKAQARQNIGAGTSSFSGSYNDLADKPTIPTKTSDLTNDSGYITAEQAKAAAPVQSVAGKTGAVTLAKGDVGLGNVDNVRQYSASNPPPYPVTSVNGKTGAVQLDIPDAYTLPVASPTQLGGVKPVAKTDAMTKGVGVDTNGGLYTEPGAWYVNITGSLSNLTVDQTPAAIRNAHSAGYAVYARVRLSEIGEGVLPIVLPLFSIYEDGGTAALMCFAGSANPHLSELADVVSTLTITYDVRTTTKWFAFLDTQPTALPNPNALTIKVGDTTTTYDGSAAKTVEVPDDALLPDVTTSDNGKFLRVVNGAWAAATVTNANGVSF